MKTKKQILLNAEQIVNNKQLGKILTRAQINFIVKEYIEEKINDSTMTKFLLAVCENGLNFSETYNLTKAMQNSGETLDLSILDGVTADKHSTGGVSDTTTLIIAPVLACNGIYFLKASGGALGHTGGTANKLQVFNGYNLTPSPAEALELTKKNGACLISQSETIAPADKKIYELRNKTNTIKNISLIASSVMCKKLALGADVILLDVKYGDGAFVKTKSEALKLGNLMRRIGIKDGKKIQIIYSQTIQPLGQNIGSKLEAMEALEVLRGKKGRLTNLATKICVNIMYSAKGIAKATALAQVKKTIMSGCAIRKFKNMISASGGSTKLFFEKYPETSQNIYSDNHGIIEKIHTEELGNICNKLESKNCDFGVRLYFKIGQTIKMNDALFSIYNCKKLSIEDKNKFLNCIVFKKKSI
ncbi:MAG: thymidine phosphorylase [Clostridia bacterium]